MPTLRSIPILVGPTGSGKTAVALHLARRYNAHVLSADSRQIYKKLRIGTAKPHGIWIRRSSDPLENYYQVENVPHHLMDILDPTETYNAGEFNKTATDLLERLHETQTSALLVGGTGMYLRALVDGIAPLPPSDDDLREELNDLALEKGWKHLHELLTQVDPLTAEKTPINHSSRIIRALEVHRLTGQPISQWHAKKTVPSNFSFQWFGLSWDREVHRRKLQERCEEMLEEGLLEETQKLLKSGVPEDAPAFQSLGYHLALEHLDGNLSKEEFMEQFVNKSRLYAKHQMTWFRGNSRIHWIEMQDPFRPEEVSQKIQERLQDASFKKV